MNQLKKSDRWLLAFIGVIIAGMLCGLLMETGIIDQNHGKLAFALFWILALNIWALGAAIKGRVHWRGGGVLVDRTERPMKFWLFMALFVLIFNYFGFIFVLGIIRV